MYARAAARRAARLDPRWRGLAGFAPALEVWAPVLSRPEPGLALLGLGKRDVSHDADLPVPVRWVRPGPGALPAAAPEGWRIGRLNDQHAHLALPPDAPLAVGDLVGCGVSHPCTTFDRWPLLFVVDEADRVVEAIRTFF
jgi:D-serine dehydratase